MTIKAPWQLIAGFSFVLGILLLSISGARELACKRLNNGSVNCLLTESIALGLIDVRETAIAPLKEVRVEERIKETIEVDADLPHGVPQIEKTPVYGVILVADENVVFNGYIYNRQRQQKIAQQIHRFLAPRSLGEVSSPGSMRVLKESHESELVLRVRNYWLDILTLSLLGVAIAIQVKLFLHKHRANSPKS